MVKFSISSLLVATAVIALISCVVAFGNRNGLFEPHLTFEEVSEKQLLRGCSKSQVIDALGHPDRKDGPYSWWSLLDRSCTSLSTLSFQYDSSLTVVNLSLRECMAKPEKLIRFEANKYKDSDVSVRNAMHHELVQRFNNDDLPSSVSTKKKVHAVFLRARFVDNWHYEGGFNGSLIVMFDEKGDVIDSTIEW